MKLYVLVSLSCVVIVIHLQSISGDQFAECDNLSSGVFTGGTQGCKSYIYCDGDDSYEGFCPSQLLFNTKDGSCAPASDVDCVDEVASTTTTIATTTTTTPSTTTTTIATTTTTPRPTETTKAAIEERPDIDIESAEDSTVTTDPPLFSDAPTTLIAAITTDITSESESLSTSRPTQVCPATDKPDEVIFLPSDVSCSEYFVCYHGTPVPMYCSGQLFFDYLTSKCELPERVNCKIGSVSTSNPRKECTVNTFDFFPYPKNCNYFYKCISGFLSLQQCPIGFGWSEEMKLCLKLDQGRCPIRALDQQQSQAWLNNVFSM